MGFLTAMFIGALTSLIATKFVDNMSTIGEFLKGQPVLTPINRTVLQNYTTAYTNAVTEKFIKKTVEEIYSSALKEASLRKEGYQHPFAPLLPIHVYPESSYLPTIIMKLEKLFPGCTVEMNERLGMYEIKWF
jgi:hypothetical protein